MLHLGMVLILVAITATFPQDARKWGQLGGADPKKEKKKIININMRYYIKLTVQLSSAISYRTFLCSIVEPP
jgi:hypothetical protein